MRVQADALQEFAIAQTQSLRRLKHFVPSLGEALDASFGEVVGVVPDDVVSATAGQRQQPGLAIELGASKFRSMENGRVDAIGSHVIVQRNDGFGRGEEGQVLPPKHRHIGRVAGGNGGQQILKAVVPRQEDVVDADAGVGIFKSGDLMFLQRDAVAAPVMPVGQSHIAFAVGVLRRRRH